MTAVGRVDLDSNPDPHPGGIALLRRRVAEAIEGHLWTRHGTARFRFEDWREEVLRPISHEGGRGRATISRECGVGCGLQERTEANHRRA